MSSEAIGTPNLSRLISTTRENAKAVALMSCWLTGIPSAAVSQTRPEDLRSLRLTIAWSSRTFSEALQAPPLGPENETFASAVESTT